MERISYKTYPISELKGLKKKYKKREEQILMDADVFENKYYEDELRAVQEIIKDLQKLIDKGRGV